MKLTDQEKQELQTTLENKYAAGPFCGMIFNAIANKQLETIPVDKQLDYAIKLALKVRIRAGELANEGNN